MPENNGQGRGLPDDHTYVSRISRNQMTRAMKLNCPRPRRRGVLVGKRKRMMTSSDLCRLVAA